MTRLIHNSVGLIPNLEVVSARPNLLNKETDMRITEEEIKNAVRVWPANVEAPLTRDEQIHLMTTARERHAAAIERIHQTLKENMMS